MNMSKTAKDSYIINIQCLNNNTRFIMKVCFQEILREISDFQNGEIMFAKW
uniref:Uncharacterized protein n=1 Tax=Arion vulgaris TaxID=1028688 RepID=A0A0B6Z412_9EUPU